MSVVDLSEKLECIAPICGELVLPSDTRSSQVSSIPRCRSDGIYATADESAGHENDFVKRVRAHVDHDGPLLAVDNTMCNDADDEQKELFAKLKVQTESCVLEFVKTADENKPVLKTRAGNVFEEVLKLRSATLNH